MSSKTTNPPPFLQLPPEIRDIIYSHLIPMENDASDAKPGVIHEGDIVWDHNGTLKFRRRHLEILRVNRQVHAEVSRSLHARTFAIILTARDVRFLQRFYECDGRGRLMSIFPRTFPFDKISVLRIRISAPREINCESSDYKRSVAMFKMYLCLCELAKALSNLAAAGRLSCKKLVIDASEPCGGYRQPTQRGCMSKGVCDLLNHFHSATRAARECEIRLGCWAKACPRMIQRDSVGWCTTTALRHPVETSGDIAPLLAIPTEEAKCRSSTAITLRIRNCIHDGNSESRTGDTTWYTEHERS